MAREEVLKHYTKLSDYYDAIYDKIVDYESQTDYLEKVLQKFHGGKVRSILDVGCGTGNFTFSFAKRGHSVTGIDLSRDMIRVAVGKRGGSKEPEFIEMDMRDIRLSKKYDAIVSLFGGFGYLLNNGDVKRFFSGVARHLNKKGLLIFEFWHVSALRPESSGKSGFRSFDRVENDGKLIIRLNTNHYDPQANICNISFETFVFNQKTKWLLDSFTEVHKLKVYSISEMRSLLKDCGFESLGFFEDHFGSSRKIESAGQSTFRVLSVATLKNSK